MMGKRHSFRTTTVKFRDWSWHARLIEKLYRLTHHGQIRTIVVSGNVELDEAYRRREGL